MELIGICIFAYCVYICKYKYVNFMRKGKSIYIFGAYVQNNYPGTYRCDIMVRGPFIALNRTHAVVAQLYKGLILEGNIVVMWEVILKIVFISL